jgi:hypothetical protein
LAQQGFPDEDHITLVNEFQFCFTFRHDASHRKIYKDAQAIRLPIVLYGEDWIYFRKDLVVYKAETE